MAELIDVAGESAIRGACSCDDGNVAARFERSGKGAHYILICGIHLLEGEAPVVKVEDCEVCRGERRSKEGSE